MKILFLTIGEMKNIEEHTIYCDLLRCFRNNGHEIYTISPYEKRTGKKTEYGYENGIHMLHMSIGNITKCGLIEKGISTILIESIFTKGVKKYFSDVKFDLVMYSTPPVTFSKTIKYVRKRDNAKTYLLLKDIFPQNAVDIGLMSSNGINGLIYKFFRNKERKLYAASDYIGCMSKANMEYVLQHNPEIAPEKIEVCPNSIEVVDKSVTEEVRMKIRNKYGLPLDKKIFVYGGNLGKPQGISFFIECLKSQEENKEAYFLIVGDGTEYEKVKNFIEEYSQENVGLMKHLPKEDYDTMVGACDIGMIFLDHRFTIPNFPSRLLSYMQAKIPVLACTDPNTDIGKVIVEGGFGWWCESKNVREFENVTKEIIASDLTEMRENAFQCLKNNYSVNYAYSVIMKHFKR